MDDIALKRDVLPVPAELRNLIYRYLVRKIYLISWPSPQERHSSALDTTEPLPNALADFPIFQVSKTTRREALALLYTESTFRYWVDKSRKSYQYRDACPDKDILDLVQNIEIHVSIPNILSDVPSLVIVQTCSEIANKLNQTSKFRNSLVIRFYDCDAPALTDNILPLFSTLASLTRFKTVVVEICGGAHQPKADENIPLAEIKTMIQPGILEHIAAECGAIKELVVNSMKEMFGPVMEEGEVDSARNVCYARYLRFYPRKAGLSTTAAAAEEVLGVDGGEGGW